MSSAHDDRSAGRSASPADDSTLLAAARSRLEAGDAEGARGLLRKAAEASSLPAAVQLGIWELLGLGGSRDVTAAAARLHDAADRGHVGASTIFAQLIAAGAAGLRRDFPAAVSRLVQAAASGDPRAAVQLALLIPEDGGNPTERIALIQTAAAAGEPIARAFAERWPGRRVNPRVDWQRLHERVALPHERSLPVREPQNERPRITAARGLLTRDECYYVLLRGLPMLRPARVFARDGSLAIDPMRSNDAAKLGLLEADVVVQSIDLRVARLLGQPAENGEGFALLRYERGQQYLPHCDWIDPSPATSRADLERWGQRIATCVVYLNDTFAGGATEFPRLGLSFRGGIGDALSWENVQPGGDVDPMTLHAGRPPTAGVKFLLSKWMRSKNQEGRDV